MHLNYSASLILPILFFLFPFLIPIIILILLLRTSKVVRTKIRCRRSRGSSPKQANLKPIPFLIWQLISLNGR